ncbi:hypothetical protein EW026_g6153 [Hermanssonia centrifuga]|uniref:DUF6589 domain-containing protein n=1 Tax=Hermanssonia centrifuga TaxID=98765 RepID=A0A4S4KGB0_9APHY|nr:hypothetical protein EW026_g6153 [Hermanssonia centrifuga]
MSQKWVYDGIYSLAQTSRISLLEDIAVLPFGGSYDNLNLYHSVYEQRLTNQSEFSSGTGATIYIIKDPAAIVPNKADYLHKLAEGRQNLISFKDIVQLDDAAGPRIRAQALHHILRFLVETPAFDFESYLHKDSAIFDRPPPVLQLPTGPEHATCQYMLDTIPIDEGSYDGNERCMDEWMKQLNLDSYMERMKTSLERIIPWLGDQLTTSQIRGFKKFHSHDLNGYKRLDHVLEHFGWFHAQIAEEHSIHNQYYGATDSLGLKHAFDLLKRKGLHSPTVKGPFHQGLQDGLYIVAAGHFRDLWRLVGGAESLADLRNRTPEELYALAVRILDDYASTNALVRLRTRDIRNQDEVQIQAVQFNRDILYYIELDDAMNTGDVGRMEDLLPRLLFCFAGGGSSNYTTELLELIQAIHREWTPEVK